MSSNRWSIYIDIEGFSSFCEKGNDGQALNSVGVLAEGLLFIGRKCYPTTPYRIFAHQIGDGFVVVSDFGGETFGRPLAIAIALLKHVAKSGLFARAAISEGEFADVRGFYPKIVRDEISENQYIALGEGLLSVFPVMGTALINAVKLVDGKVEERITGVAKGPLLIVAKKDKNKLPADVRVHETKNSDLLYVDWVHSDYPLANHVSQTAGLHCPRTKELEDNLIAYCLKHKDELSSSWIASVRDLLSVKV